MPAVCLAVLVATGCARGAVSVHDVQGTQDTSSLDGQPVTLEDVVVTLVAPRGFFVRTRPGREDDDPRTSEGLYVFTGGAPRVKAGDRLRLSGRVTELHGHTQLIHPGGVRRLGRTPVPAPVALGAAPVAGWESLESMRVSLDEATVAQASDVHGEARIAPGLERPFRRPGGRASPTIEVDPGALGGPGRMLMPAQHLRVTGALVFRYGDYVLWPESLEPRDPPALPRAVAAPAEGQMTVATFNLQRFFDDESAGGEPSVSAGLFSTRLTKASGWLQEVLHCPAVVAVQEVESAEVLGRIGRASGCGYSAVSRAHGPHPGLGFLVRNGTTATNARELGAHLRLDGGGALFDRPPLALDVHLGPPAGGLELTLVDVHLRSQLDVGRRWVQRKRKEQARALRDMVEALEGRPGGGRLLVLGDFNAVPFSDGLVDVLARVTGARDSSDAFGEVHRGKPALVNLVRRLPGAERYTYVHHGQAEALDHVLVEQALAPMVSGFAAARGNADAPAGLANRRDTLLRASDHDPLVVYLAVGAPASR